MNSNTTVVISGPGAGKTHNMVNKVLSALNDLTANKYCCVITYTNAATEEIRERISKRIDIPQNLFVGTIHSFLIKFIIEPYAHLLNFTGIEKSYIEDIQVNLPKYVGSIPQNAFCKIEGITLEKSRNIREELINSKILSKFNKNVNISFSFRPDDPDFKLKLKTAPNLEDEVVNVIKNRHSSSKKKFKELGQKKHRNKILLQNSILTYDQILQTSEEIISNEKIKNKISKRISYLFVDEYQDLRLIQHNILIKLLSTGTVKGFVIGDPFQNIFDFTYYQSLFEEEKPDFDNSPMMSLYNKDTVIESRNWRSTKEITNFVRNFTQFKQDSEKSIYSGIDVTFINNITKANIKQRFESIINDNSITKEKDKFFKTILFYTNKGKNISKLIAIFDSSELSNKSSKLSTYREFERVFLAATGYKKKEILDKYNLSILELRHMCIILYKRIKSDYQCYNDVNHLLNSLRCYVKNDLKIEICKDKSNVKLDNLIINIFESNIQLNSDYYHSTIHKFKGLESTCILVIARTEKELNNFIETDLNEIKKSENKRLGYVAFSRARKLLCIACLEKIDDTTQKKLELLNVKIVE